jgi:1-acyl-sn-glycerol-3-phosphate acyltransferase
MNRQPFEKPPRWWSPQPNRFWIRFWRPFRKRQQVKVQRLLEIEVRGAEYLRQAVAEQKGILITPNHASHADCFATYGIADRVDIPLYIMVAWQVFQRSGRLKRLALRHHGCFSVDREGTDMQAFRQAVEILESGRYPLVVFPEGEVYHINDRITPFREGPAAMALLAARKSHRPIVCLPCAFKYRYLADPTAELLQLMEKLERAIYWRPRPDLTLRERIYHLAEGALALKEIEFLGRACEGPLPGRITYLIDFILNSVESRQGLDFSSSAVPERVKGLRRHLIRRTEEMPPDDPRHQLCREDLEDVFLAVQLFSYPGDYVARQPSIEHIAETFDKFEEDILGRKTATIRGTRKATVTIGEPLPVIADRSKNAAAVLTRLLEERVQFLLDEKEPLTGYTQRVS